jgi:hypothetical protein
MQAKKVPLPPPNFATLQLVQMSFGGYFGQPVPMATHWPIGQVVPYQGKCGNWHVLAENAAITDSSW